MRQASNSLSCDDFDLASDSLNVTPATIEWSDQVGYAPRHHLRILPTISSLQVESSASEGEPVGQSISAALDNGSLNALLDSAWARADQELLAYLNLPEGWDGYAGMPFDAGAVQLARDFLSDLISVCRQSDVVPVELYPGPVSDGSVQIEVRVGDRYLLGTFRAGSRDVGIYREGGIAEVEEQVALGSSDLATRLGWLVGAVSL